MKAFKKLLNSDRENIAISSVTNLLVKLSAIALSLLLVPKGLAYLGKEEYGIVLSIYAFQAALAFADLGLGFTIQADYPKIYNRGDKLSRAVSTTFLLLCVFAAFTFIAGLIFIETTPWLHWIKATKISDPSEIKQSAYIFLISFCAALPLSIVQRIQIAKGQAYRQNIFIFVSNSLVCILLFSLPNDLMKITTFIFLLTTVPLLATVVNFSTSILYGSHFKISIRNWDSDFLRKSFKKSGLFLLVQTASVVLVYSNTLFVLSNRGPGEVAVFTVSYRYMLLLLMPIETIAPYLTPSINRDIISGNFAGAKKLIRLALFGAVVASAIAGLISFSIGPSLVNFWTNGNVHIDYEVLTSVVIFLLIYGNVGCVLSYTMLSNNLLRFNALAFTTSVLVCLPIKYLWISINYRTGAFLGTALPMSIGFVVPCLYALKRKNLL